MKTILFILCCIGPLFLAAQTLYPFKLKEEAKFYKKRKVKTILTYEQSEDAAKKLHHTANYNEKGQLINVVHNGNERALTVDYQYNTDGLLAKQSRHTQSGEFKGSVEYNYKKGRLITETHTVKSNPYTITYHYDSDGHIDSSFISSVAHQRDVWHYNDQGKVSAILGFNMDDFDKNGNWVQEYKEVFYYNKSGLLSQSASCFGRLCYVDKFFYNKKRQKIKTLEFEGSSLVGKTTYEYSKKGLLEKIEHTPDEEVLEPEPKVLTTMEYSYH